MHHPNYDHEGSQDLSHTFQEMATSAGLMDLEVYEVQEVWTGWKDHWAELPEHGKGFPKGHPVFPGDASHLIA